MEIPVNKPVTAYIEGNKVEGILRFQENLFNELELFIETTEDGIGVVCSLVRMLKNTSPTEQLSIVLFNLHLFDVKEKVNNK